MTPILLDTDPGIDDAMAIFYALADPEIELVGMTTVFGNVRTPDATRNALGLAELAGREIPVAEGAHAPLVQTPNGPSSHVHGERGLGKAQLRDPQRAPDPRPAHLFIAETVAARPGEITLLAVGPLTNLALALQHHPQIVRQVKSVVVMGGAVRTKGNVTDFAEANIWNDPHAADIVFAADWDVSLVGLDVTEKIRCLASDFQAMVEASPCCGAILSKAAEFYFDFHRRSRELDACFLHDPAAAIMAVQPDLFETVQIPLAVVVEGEEIGMTAESAAGNRRPVSVAVDVDAEAVRARFLEHLGSGALP